jgi:type III secretion protein Q
MASIRPLALVRLDARQAQALRRLGGQFEGLEVTGLLADPTSVRMRLSPLALAEREAVSLDGLVRLSMEWAGGRLLLDLSEQAAGVWLRGVLGSSAYGTLPPDWFEPAIGHAVEHLSRVMEPLGRGPLQLASIDKAPSDVLMPGFHPLWLEAVLGDERITGLLQLDSMSLLLAASLMPPVEAAKGPLSADSVPMPFVLCIGQTRLSLAQLGALRPGGVVVIAEPFSTQPRELILLSPERAGRAWGLRAVLEAASLNILERAHPMNTETQSEAASDGLGESLSELPVKLSFDLGERTLTLAELQALDVGSALNLDRPLQDFVTLRVNGVVVGEGQLVEMEGRLGVMVSRLALGGLA